MTEPTWTADATPTEVVRARIVAAAAELIATGGRRAATTRAVATAAGVQAPTIYRLFGDKRGPLDAATQHGLAAYIAKKSAREPNPDPVQELRDGWKMHVGFGLSNPGLFTIMAHDPHPRALTPSAAAGLDILRWREACGSARHARSLSCNPWASAPCSRYSARRRRDAISA